MRMFSDIMTTSNQIEGVDKDFVEFISPKCALYAE